MNIFDKSILQIIDECAGENIAKLEPSAKRWEILQKNPFLMERDTLVELGGYPKDSINIIVPSSNLWKLIAENDKTKEAINNAGLYIIGDRNVLNSKENHASFGKIVLLETEEIPDEEWYEFTQNELMTDSKIRMKDVMLRQSPTHYNINLRVGKQAIKNGFDLSVMGKTIYESFMSMKYVKSAVVILIAGESPLYKSLLKKAEKIKEVTLTLNHIFDGIDMDCGHCDLSEICNEVGEIRALHKRRNKNN